jgi:hypothetical protein
MKRVIINAVHTSTGRFRDDSNIPEANRYHLVADLSRHNEHRVLLWLAGIVYILILDGPGGGIKVCQGGLAQNE